MTRSGWSRRRFLQRGGQAAGICFLGAGTDAFLATPSRGSAPPTPASRPAALDDAMLETVLSEIVRDLEKRALYASAFFEERGGIGARAEAGERTVDPENERRGVVIQAYDGVRFREASTDRLERDELRRLARELAGDLSAPPRGAVRPDPGSPLRREVESPYRVDPATVAPSEWLRLCEDAVARIRARDARILNASGFASYRWRRTLFVNRTRVIRQTLHTVGSGAFAFAMDRGKPAPAWMNDRGAGGFERAAFGDDRVDELLRIMEDLLVAERIEPGEHEVIATPAVTGLLAHESFGHGVEYDQFIKGRAKAAHFLGKRVAPENVSIWDDPTQAGANGSYVFDDEGWEAAPTGIVEGGVFRRPITDLFSSHVGTAPRTANGRRESFANKAYARMSNTYFGRGETPVDEIVGTLANGIYLEGFQSGIEDPHGWGIQFTCNRGYEIRNGRRTGRVFSPIGVTGYVPEILASITHVGDDFDLVPGTCGKGHKEYVPVASGGPHLRFTARLG